MYSLLYFLAETYYTPLILLSLSLATVIIGYHNRHKFAYLRLFPIYAVASTIQIIISLCCIFFIIPSYKLIINFSSIAFTIIEFLIFYDLLFHIIRDKFLTRSMEVSRIVFLVLTLCVLLTSSFSNVIPLSFNVINLILLIIPCLFFFYEVFNTSPSIPLSYQPAFWIITGFAFMIICTLPFYLLEKYFFHNMINLYNKISALTYAFYCLLFILICKAFLCKQMTVK